MDKLVPDRNKGVFSKFRRVKSEQNDEWIEFNTRFRKRGRYYAHF
jgi:hypothetical protein